MAARFLNKEDNMDNKELLQERIKLFSDAVEFKKVKRVPRVSNAWTWKIADCDLQPKLSESLADFSIMERCVREHHERYNFDTYIDLGVRNNVNVSKALGHTQHVVDDEHFRICAVDEVTIGDDEFDEYTKDPNLFVWKKVGPMFFENLTYQDIEDAVKANQKYVNYVVGIQNTMVYEYGVPLLGKTVALHPLENVLNAGRGIKNISTDLRRRPEKLMAITDVKASAIYNTVSTNLDTPSDNYAFDLRITMLMHSLTNRKQFEEIFWPFIRNVIDIGLNKDKKIFLFVEASIQRLADFFDDFKRGNICMLNEMDDIFELRERFPNLALCGGMNINMLQYGSPEECKVRVRKLVSEMGPGYIFGQDKMMSFRTDGRRENMLAAREALDELGM